VKGKKWFTKVRFCIETNNSLILIIQCGDLLGFSPTVTHQYPLRSRVGVLVCVNHQPGVECTQAVRREIGDNEGHTSLYEKQGDRWLILEHHSSLRPEAAE
jgi:hypothetical protein